MKRITTVLAVSLAIVASVTLVWIGVDQIAAATGPAPSLAAGGWRSESTPAEPTPAAPSMATDDGSQRLLIDDLGVAAELVPGGIADGELVLPDDPAVLALSTAGADPCTNTEGTVLVSGHVASHGVKGALWPLAQARAGTIATITCPGGRPSRWRAVRAWQSAKADLDQSVFDTGGSRRLVVITCGGPVLTSGHYRDNVIVEFEPIGDE